MGLIKGVTDLVRFSFLHQEMVADNKIIVISMDIRILFIRLRSLQWIEWDNIRIIQNYVRQIWLLHILVDQEILFVQQMLEHQNVRIDMVEHPLQHPLQQEYS